jgi:endonuclease/exonuclease/phosphatase family metal-dependent hydrolase
MLTLLSCGTVRVYEQPDKPVFVSNEITNATSSYGDSLTVLTFNIEKAKKIKEAISELQAFEKKTPIDIYLLQEMDEGGVQSIAKELSLNYLYIPIVYNSLLKKNMGNAILTKGTVSFHKKLILPNTKWVNGRHRHVTVGEVTIRNKKILVYSVHTETSTMKRKKRMEQLDAIIRDAGEQTLNYNQIIIGGDFNTAYAKDVNAAVEKFNAAGFQWGTEATGNTARAFFGLIKPREDHIFYKGMKLISAGKIESSTASDHYPVYSILKDSL